jgi:hypothetical protein
MAKLRKCDQQKLWAEAQRRYRLSDEVIRMARELGLGPRGLIKNIPSPKQQWKAPVEDWVRDIYEKSHRATSRRGSRSPDITLPEAARAP